MGKQGTRGSAFRRSDRKSDLSEPAGATAGFVVTILFVVTNTTTRAPGRRWGRESEK
jgi:hypothetical protein